MRLFKDHFRVQLNNKIKACNQCILKDNPGPVLGYGSINADVLFVADAPGRLETQKGIPFIGTAKDKIVKMIKDIGLNKEEYYFTYFFKHSIVSDHDKIKLETCKKCIDYLIEEIELVNPRIICSMGYHTTNALLKYYKLKEVIKSLNKLHGNGYIIPYLERYNKIVRPKRYLIPTWNPASDKVIMNKQFKKDILTIKIVRNMWISLSN